MSESLCAHTSAASSLMGGDEGAAGCRGAGRMELQGVSFRLVGNLNAGGAGGNMGLHILQQRQGSGLEGLRLERDDMSVRAMRGSIKVGSFFSVCCCFVVRVSQ